MGEVKVQIHLTNAIDEGLVRRGQMAAADVRTAQVEALVDTSAVNCVLPPFIADRLGLARPFRQMAEYADGRREEVDVTEPVLLDIEGRKVYEECLVLGDEVLIGQTALEKTDLHVDGRSRKLLPNPAHPYQQVVKVRRSGTGRARHPVAPSQPVGRVQNVPDIIPQSHPRPIQAPPPNPADKLPSRTKR